jgi:4'-phosphopantetheinyl transferase EntD
MDTRVMLQAWHEILPACVCVSAGPMLDFAMPLTKRERDSAGMVEAERMHELENGREYAKRALAILGMCDVEIPIAPDRAPLWPDGVVGSLTHAMGRGDGHVAAAVASMRAVCAVGIDVECEDSLQPRTWNYVMTACERKRILALPPHIRVAEAQTVWCAKEATAKAARRPIDPTDVEIVPAHTGSGFAAIWRAAAGSAARAGEIWHGRTVRAGGFVFAAVVRPQGGTGKAHV